VTPAEYLARLVERAGAPAGGGAPAGPGAARLRWGGAVVAIRCAGPALGAAVLPAFAHLAEDGAPGGAPPDLRIHVAGGEAAGPAAPRGGGWGPLDRLHYRDARYQIHHAPGGPLSAIDLAGGVAAVWFPDGPLPNWERAAPLRTVLNWWLERRGAHLVHAAALAAGGRAVLLAGRGGAGKSATAVAALLGGAGYLADDYCVVESGSPAAVSSLFATAKLDARALGLLGAGGLPAEPPRAPGDKWLLPLAGHPGLERRARLAAVVLPRLGGGPGTALEPCSRGAALAALAPSSLFQLARDRAGALAALAGLLRDVPAFALRIGGSPREAAGAALAALAPAAA
jgi:hypothetical protein